MDMLNISDLIKTIIMGVVEGFTEFLPISSTGHLILTGNLLGGFDNEASKVFEISIQAGAILAVILVYWQKLIGTLRDVQHPSSASQAIAFMTNVLIGFLPAAILGISFSKAIKENLFNAPSVATAFIVGGFVILWAEHRQSKSIQLANQKLVKAYKDSVKNMQMNGTTDVDGNPSQVIAKPKRIKSSARINDVAEMSWLDALKVGFAQTFALIPGTSRSGATIIGGMCLGLSRQAATQFSFYLAIPTLMGATAYSLYKARDLLNVTDVPWFLVGTVVSFFSAWLCIRWLLRFIATHSFVPFAYYRIAFGLLILLTHYQNWVVWKD